MSGNLYNSWFDTEINAIPRAISAQSVATFFGVSVDRVEQARAKAALKGRGPSRESTMPPKESDGPAAYRMQCELSSELLLKAQLQSGQHFINDNELYQRRCREVGL